MLKNPVLDDAVNPEAASMFRNSYKAYSKVARECVEYSQLLDSKLNGEGGVFTRIDHALLITDYCYVFVRREG